MGNSNAFAAAGTVLSRGTSGTTTDYSTVSGWTACGDVQSLDGPGLGRNMIDCTHMTSPNNEEEFIVGRKTRSPIQVQGSFAPVDPTQSPAAGFLADRDSGAKRGYAIEWSDQLITTYLFNAYVEEFKITSEQAGKVNFSLTLRPSGGQLWKTGGK